jgi:hypothetical protein
MNLKINFRRELRDFFTSYGPIPRILFEQLLNMPQNDAKPDTELRRNIEKNVEMYEYDLRERVQLAMRLDPEVLFSRNADTSFSTGLILLSPVPDDRWKYIAGSYEATLMTPHIAALFSEATTKLQTQRARELYEFLLSNGCMCSAAGWVFETRVHVRFERTGTFELSSIFGGGSLKEISINLNGDSGTKTRTFVFNQLSQLCAHLRVTKGAPDINPQLFNVYLRPHQCNLESIDALTIIQTPRGKRPRLVCFQITVGAKHGIKAAGLRAILKHIPAAAKILRPALVFVVPAETAYSFTAQKIEGQEPEDEEWSQYMLAMDSEELWRVKTL